MTCKKYEDKINGKDFTAFVCDMGIKRVSKEDYDRLLKGNKSLIDKNKKLKDILKDFMETKEDLRTWKYEMAATIDEALNE